MLCKMKECCVCGISGSKYKCPTCTQEYCSAVCCQSHKKTGCKPPTVEPIVSKNPKNSVKYEFPTEDTVPLEKLELLQDSDEVKKCLKNPHVRDIIRSIVHHKNPTSAIAEAMTEPIFIELADACLKVVESSHDDKPC